MSNQIDLIAAIENQLLDLIFDDQLPSQTQNEIEQACLAIMQARNHLQLSLERTAI